jgi:hypothetical protein
MLNALNSKKKKSPPTPHPTTHTHNTADKVGKVNQTAVTLQSPRKTLSINTESIKTVCPFSTLYPVFLRQGKAKAEATQAKVCVRPWKKKVCVRRPRAIIAAFDPVFGEHMRCNTRCDKVMEPTW